MNKPIKLLFIIDYFKNPYAGTEGQLYKLIEGLDKSRYKPCFVVFRNSDYLDNNEFPISVDVLNLKRLSSPGCLFTLLRYFFRKKKDGYRLAHIYFNDPSIICPPILKLLGYKILISRRDMGYWYTRLNIFLLRINALFVSKVIANSNAVKSITVKYEWYKDSSVEVIYNGYQESNVEESLKPDEIIRAKGEVRIILVANIRPIKRIQDAIKAIKVAHDDNDKIALYVLGDGDASHLTALAEDLGINKFIHFLGSRDDVLQLLPEFHIGILCSQSEGFSNTLIEYMQSGLPVICTKVGGNPEIIEHGVNGFLYEAGDTSTLANHVVELAGDGDMRRRMGCLGKEKVNNNYELSKCVQSHQKLYKQLMT